MKRTIFSVVLVLMASVIALADAAKKGKGAAAPGYHAIFAPGDIQWSDAPPVLPAGAKIAVLEGAPDKPGSFTMRLKFPDGYKIMPHWHPGIEHVTVISGTFNVGLGDKFDGSKGNAMPAGAFGFLAPKMHHFAWAKGETEIQVHTI